MVLGRDPVDLRFFPVLLMPQHCLTHSGTFHADDVLSAVLLKLLGKLEGYDKLERTRDTSRFEVADIVFDVGGEYDPSKGRFDHHQRGRSGECWEDGTPLSSAGLVWKAYGEELVPDSVEYLSLQGNWIQPIDADDNGWLPELPKNVRHVSSIVSDLNPRWDDEDGDFDASFTDACIIIEKLFLASWNRAKGKRVARERVLEAIEANRGSSLLVLQEYCPWKSHLHRLEIELEVEKPFTWVLFPSDDSWKIFQVPVEKGSREGRASFPESWGGLREDDLRKTSGVPDATFVHPGLFCGGAVSREGAETMAKLSMPGDAS